MIRVAINGFGRIGRMFFRAAAKDKSIKVVAINDLGDPKALVFALKYDSVHGKFEQDVSTDGKHLIVGRQKIPLFSAKDPAELPWKKLKIDVVMDSTGHFVTSSTAQKHIDAGAKRVVISAPAKQKTPEDVEIKTIVMGVNHDTYKKETIVSNASCTTNCYAPVAEILHRKFGIKKGYMTTVHSYTATQAMVDGADGKDPRRARAAALNIVPSSSGAAIATGKVLPELDGKLHASALRVPTADASISYCVFELDKAVSADEINKALKAEEKSKRYRGVIACEEDPIVSSDIIGRNESSIVDVALTETDGKLAKVVSWYDNEWGYSCRLVDLIRHIS